MLDTLLSLPFAPFAVSLALLFGLLGLELVLLLLGGSLVGDGADLDGPDIDIEAGIGALDLDALDAEAAEFDFSGSSTPTVSTSPLTWIGLGRMPTLIWLAMMFMSFGVSGLVLQNASAGVFGAPLPPLIATLPCAVTALWFTGKFGTAFARLMPRNETQSVSTRQLGRRTGTVTQGTAARGNPAEVRVTDRYCNTHYLRAEPMDDAETIPEGATVLVLRHRPTGAFRLIAL